MDWNTLPFDKPHFVLLESSLGGQWTIAAWDPVEVIQARENESGEDFLERFREVLVRTPKTPPSKEPFTGGWIGYLGYELGASLEKSVPDRPTSLIPRAMMTYYDRFSLYDGSGSLEERGELPVRRAPKVTRCESDYFNEIQKIKKWITAGDCYQVNLSQKFSQPISTTAPEIYHRLRAVSPAPYSAYLNLGNAQILSSSPECFLEVNGRRVITRPIKGTRPRGGTSAEDASLKEELVTSTKDRAELLMITDLERNDLGRVCRPGSIHVSDLRKVETFPQVHHTVATIEGELDDGHNIIDLLKATFPGGSITGAPKVRAMQIIRELEPHAREIYCGAIGYISTNGRAQFNVAIRTMVVKDGQAHFWSGGGIVADSHPESEYQESLVKAEGIRRALAD